MRVGTSMAQFVILLAIQFKEHSQIIAIQQKECLLGFVRIDLWILVFSDLLDFCLWYGMYGKSSRIVYLLWLSLLFRLRGFGNN